MLGLSRKLTRNEISKYERGLRGPALAVLLKYARAAKVNVEVLIDDDLELPAMFVHRKTKSMGVVNSSTKRTKRKKA